MGCIIVDTEYTTWPGALESGWSAPGQYREIVQVAAIQVNDAFEETGSFDLLIRPAINPVLSPLFVELTHISQAAVDERGLDFPQALDRFLKFTSGGMLPVLCMNADEAVFQENCRLSSVPFPFDISWHRLRPFLERVGVDTHAHASGDLHKLTDTPLLGHRHNALHDVRSMACWLRYAQREGIFHKLAQLPTGAPTTDPRSLPRM